MKNSKKTNENKPFLKTFFLFCSIFFLLVVSVVAFMYYRQSRIDTDLRMWKTYTTPGVSFSIMYPPDWSIQEQKAIKDNATVAVNMTNTKSGSISISWSIDKPIGIDCQTPLMIIKTRTGRVNCCQASCPANAQSWSISKKLTNSPYYLYVKSYSSQNNAASKDIVLKILSTLSMQ